MVEPCKQNKQIGRLCRGLSNSSHTAFENEALLLLLLGGAPDGWRLHTMSVFQNMMDGKN